MKKEELIITILKYAKANPGFTYMEIYDALKDKFDMKGNDKHILNLTIEKISHNLEGKVYLNYEGTFSLLEYEELNEARKSAKDAKRDAIIAIGISILGFIASIYFSIQSINLASEANRITMEQTEIAKKPIEISQENIQEIKVSKSLEQKIDSLIKIENKILTKLNQPIIKKK